MAGTEPEDFELDKAADYSPATSVGQRNRAIAQLAMGSYEALLAHVFAVGEFSQKSLELCLRLFGGYQRVADLFTEKSSGAGRPKRGPSAMATKLLNSSALSLAGLTSLLEALFSDAYPSHQQPLSVLRASAPFARYLLSIALNKIRQVCERGSCAGAFFPHEPEKLFRSCCRLARVLFSVEEGGGGAGHRDGGKKEKGKSVQVLCLEGFCQLLQTVSSRHPGRLEAFLSSIKPAAEEDTTVSKLHYFIRHFQRLVTGVLNGDVKEFSYRDAHSMTTSIALLAAELSTDSPQLEQVYDWTLSQCSEQNFDDSHLSRALVDLLLSLSARRKEDIKAVKKLSQDIHFHQGDIDEDMEVEGHTHFAIVNPQTACSSILPLVLSQSELLIADADWLIGALKAEAMSSSSELFDGVDAISSQSENLFSGLCERSVPLVVAYHELVQSALPSGHATESLLKSVTKLYGLVGNMAKYQLSVYAQLSYVLPAFKKLVDTVGNHLSQQVYCLISFVQNQTPDSRPTDRVGKKSGGKGKAKASSSGRSMVRREVRSVPSLIFAMEQLEKFLIQLSKKSKVNLMEGFKRSTARDFRISGQKLDAIFNEEDEEEVEEEEGEEGEGEGEEGAGGSGEGPGGSVCVPPKAKKLKKC